MLKALKIEGPLSYGDWADLAQQLRTGALDALVVAAGVPFPSFLELETNGKLRFLPLTAQQIADLRLTLPELTLSTVPPGIYASLPSRYQTVGLFNFAVGQTDLPDNLVYAILDAVFSRHDELIETHPAAAETVPANFTRNRFLPFHNGAVGGTKTMPQVGLSRAINRCLPRRPWRHRSAAKERAAPELDDDRLHGLG